MFREHGSSPESVDKCRSCKKQRDRLAEILECGVYYSDAKRKTENVESWEKGESEVMVATGALGAGVDISGIEFVLHLGEGFGLIDYGAANSEI